MFNLEPQGWSHWFLGTRLCREKDGSYLLDKENYINHILNRYLYCRKDTPWSHHQCNLQLHQSIMFTQRITGLQLMKINRLLKRDSKNYTWPVLLVHFCMLH